MPLYEFRCQQCGERFEKLVRTSSEEGVRCPRCGSSATERLLSAFSVAGGSRAGWSQDCTPSSGSG